MNQKEPYPLNPREKELLHEEEKKLGRPLTELSGGPAYSMCFACGKENPLGLHLHFFSIPGGCLDFFTPSHEHQSYNDRMHGGLIMTLMDEVMGNYLFLNTGIPAYTGKMETRFRTPVLIGETVKVVCREIRRKGPLSVMEARVLHEDGTVAAEATSHMMFEQKG